MAVLVTGGAGYIGTHTCVELLNSGEEVVVIDNLSNSSEDSLAKVEEITCKNIRFYRGNLLDDKIMHNIFTDNTIDSVIHFAGLKAVGESCEKPMEYYHNNISGTLNLCRFMSANRVKNLVFSSSATVYGAPEKVPVKEEFPLFTSNPYGSTKLFVEQILMDLLKYDSEWSIALLRYFNPVGAHSSGLIGENPNGIPNNIMPRLLKVANGEVESLTVYGNDYETKDGTGVRDYIHITDLCIGHIKALEKVRNSKGIEAYNLGTGIGYSVYEIIDTFEKANEVKINNHLTERRAGDIAECYADPEKAENQLGWKAELDLTQMCIDAWRYAKNTK